jgi:hypothetical protein
MMMSDRSYAQIRWHQDRIGLMMVNNRREKFFLLGEKLQDLYARQDEYLVVKLRDRRSSRAIGYYPGQVVATLDSGRSTVKIRLYISEPHRDVLFKTEDDVVEPDTFHVEQVYSFPASEFDAYKKAIDTMLEQAQLFTDQLRAAEMTPLS